VIQPAPEARATLRAVPSADAVAPQEPTAQEFFARWARGAVPTWRPLAPADDPAPATVPASAAEHVLTGDELAAVARHVAPIFGDRPLGALTFGELAALPALLESHGFAPEASRAACRALGSAIRSELSARPDARH
jgi:hypothetical protein